jgi:ribosomal protein S1
MLGPSMPDKPSESFASLFEAESRGQSAKKLRIPALGERCRAEVVQIGKDSVFVELLQESGGKRQQAYLDLIDLRAPDGQPSVKLGDVIEAVVVEVLGSEVRLGRGMGKPQGAEELERAFQARVAVEGKV